MKQPSADETKTWHVHNDDTWAWGAVCEACVVERPEPVGGPLFAIYTLKRHNVEGTNTFAEVREVLENVKPEDRDKIARV